MKTKLILLESLQRLIRHFIGLISVRIEERPAKPIRSLFHSLINQ